MVNSTRLFALAGDIVMSR